MKYQAFNSLVYTALWCALVAAAACSSSTKSSTLSVDAATTSDVTGADETSLGDGPVFTADSSTPVDAAPVATADAVDADGAVSATDAAADSVPHGGVDSTETTTDSGSVLDCNADLAALQAALTEAALSHGGCGQDSDCVVVPSGTACQGTCGVALNADSAAAFAAALAKLDDKYCISVNFSATCGYSTPKCMAPAPACVDGTCVYTK